MKLTRRVSYTPTEPWLASLARAWARGDPVETLASRGEGLPEFPIDYAALYAAGWTQGPLETCVRCGHGTALRAPDAKPYHSWCRKVA